MNDPTGLTSSVMRPCGLRRLAEGRQAGVKAWHSSKAGGWRPGCGPLGASLPVRPDLSGRTLARELTGIWLACWPQWLSLSWGEQP